MKNGKLLPERIKKLDDMGFNWSAVEYKWENMFNELLAYQALHGHVRVPSTTPNLGPWVSKQRRARDDLSAERKERLEAVPGWVWNLHSEQWETGFRYLQEFANHENHCKVPTKYQTPDGYRLGQWVQVQRSSLESMPAERKERLEALPGWYKPR